MAYGTPTKTCTVHGCDKPQHAKRMCRAHYDRVYHDRQIKGPIQYKRTIDRRYAVYQGRIFINQTCGCWNWLASTTRSGYGTACFDGRRQPAHRFVYESLRGPIQEGKMLCHTCDNRACVNPDHMFVGDNAANQNDCVAKGRHHHAKKTHCKRGHPFDEANTIHTVSPNGKPGRKCRECQRQHERRRQEKSARRRSPR